MVVKKSTSKKMVKKTSRKTMRKVSKTMSKSKKYTSKRKTMRKTSRKTKYTSKRTRKLTSSQRLRGGDPVEKKAGVTAAMIGGPSDLKGTSKSLESAKPITVDLISEQTKQAEKLNITGIPDTPAFRRSPPAVVKK